jgi:hypothetical protein
MTSLQDGLSATPERARRVRPLITLPILLIALLKFGAFSVHLYRPGDGWSTWHFRFSPKAVLEVSDAGDWRWRQGGERWQRRIAPFLALAEALLAGEHDQQF